MCNGKGTCRCGMCTCDKDAYYSGPTCEDCPVSRFLVLLSCELWHWTDYIWPLSFQACPGKCDENKACVQCMAFQTGELTQEYCQANCTHVEVVPYVEGMSPSIGMEFLPRLRGWNFNCDIPLQLSLTVVCASSEMRTIAISTSLTCTWVIKCRPKERKVSWVIVCLPSCSANVQFQMQ